MIDEPIPETEPEWLTKLMNTPPSQPKPFVFPGICRRVIDGDTLEADIDRGWNDWTHAARIRLINCWAQESRGPKANDDGLAAKIYLESLVKPGDKLLIASLVKVDAFGRVLADVWVGENPVTLNKIMVHSGHATIFKNGVTNG